jgi:signal transduction histidine kinase
MQLEDEDVKTALKKIKESTLRADTIVRNLLKFAMPSEIKTEKLIPQDLVKDTLALIKYRSNLANLKLTCDFSKENIHIEADRNQLQQVLFNVIMNAIDAMPKGGEINIKVYKACSEEFSGKKPACVIEVADTGEGIAKENLPRLFEPFFTTRRDKKGTGLGLAMSKTIVENNRGLLSVDSELGKGTRVRVVLPLCVF